MTAIFVLRHPQTTWNRASRYQGRLDTPLSREGQRQSLAAADAFRGDSLDCVITSPLGRARHLAERLAAITSAPLRIDSRLTEMGQGAWEGLHVAEIRARFPELMARWHSRPDLVRFPGGESLNDVERRTTGALSDIFRLFPGGSVALITHSVIVQVLVSRCLNLDLRFLHSIKVSNAGITTICGSASPGSLLSLNVTQALYGSPAESASAESCAGNSNRSHTT